ncbi:heme NO-binding domain-containing protein [Thiomicrospira sp. ALE5]|uniref:heme NO-binding domain-containing protein n=1 Tax=Thiomicrospira sp. ALE5 TaxID=748650 RepID=UPI0008E86C08|nr:heme NO-binding domain-containing protein [Thiomicrospira sp. ALE5]SFR55952.1 Haem-NO-binding [Thiomicrospira sp. ALE5]
MKGMVFTEFLDMVEEKFSADMVDDIIDDTNPPSGAAYTAVGTYDHQELVNMVIALSKRTDIPADDLVKVFGEHVFSKFASSHKQFLVGIDDSLTFLAGIEDIIHAEVIKLYPDAQLPKFKCTFTTPNCLTMDYQSPRHFADLAEGLIKGCGSFFGDTLVVNREDINEGLTRFSVSRINV